MRIDCSKLIVLAAKYLFTLAELESTARGSNQTICPINMLINHLNMLITVHSLEKISKPRGGHGPVYPLGGSAPVCLYEATCLDIFRRG
jgi:hypothetical protein